MLRGFLLGSVVTLCLVGAGGALAVVLGVIPPGADVPPGKLETWAAITSLDRSIDKASAGLRNPLALTDENLRKGLDVYEQHCLICHGASDGAASDIAIGLNIPAPQFADETVGADAVARTYWVARHGIRFTGMPAFASTLSDTQLWQVAMFITRVDKLPTDVEEAWQKLPSMEPKPAP